MYLIQLWEKSKDMDNFNYKVRIITEYDNDYRTMLLQAQLPDLEITENNQDADIVIGSPPLVAPILDKFENLTWLQSCYAGVDALTKPELRQDYDLTNVKGIFGQQIAEYVLGHTINYFRHFNQYKQQQSEKCWQPHHYRTTADKLMVILGTGSIGNHLAKTAAAFNISTIGINTTGIPPKDSGFDQIAHIEQVTDYLAQADIIVSTLPSTERTVEIFNHNFFAHCSKALFFNVGRGDAVHTPSLLEALEKDYIAHAFLDVFINEPISDACPYWHNPKVTVTPHIAACSFPEQVIEIFTENYLRWRDGFQLIYRINFDSGY